MKFRLLLLLLLSFSFSFPHIIHSETFVFSRFSPLIDEKRTLHTQESKKEQEKKFFLLRRRLSFHMPNKRRERERRIVAYSIFRRTIDNMSLVQEEQH